LQRDRRTGLRVVVERLPHGDAEQEEQEGDPNPDAPPDQLLPAAAASAFVTLDRRERRHGA
jgi:hypothetical protein